LPGYEIQVIHQNLAKLYLFNTLQIWNMYKGIKNKGEFKGRQGIWILGLFQTQICSNFIKTMGDYEWSGNSHLFFPVNYL
jgi:hypothetical protein